MNQRSDRVTVRRLAMLVLAGALIPALATCARRGEPQSTWLADQALLHAELDAALSAGRNEWAEKTLLAALAQRAPIEMQPEVLTLVRKDQLFRLADIYLTMGDPERALTASERGLAVGGEQDLFTANLHLARGEALAALSREPEAAVAFHHALLINDRMLHDLLQDD